jgi:hypothetical protein
MTRLKSAARVLGLLLAGGAIVLMSRTTPGFVDLTAPFVIRGEPGEWVNTRTFGLRVDKPHLVRRLTQNRFGRVEERTTSGVWVVVKVEAVAIHHPGMIGGFALETRDGKRYQHTERVRLPSQVGLLGRELQPEMPVPALLVFEVPENQISNLTLVAGEREIPHLTSEARIPLRWSDPDPAASIRDSVDLSS